MGSRKRLFITLTLSILGTIVTILLLLTLYIAGYLFYIENIVPEPEAIAGYEQGHDFIILHYDNPPHKKNIVGLQLYSVSNSKVLWQSKGFTSDAAPSYIPSMYLDYKKLPPYNDTPISLAEEEVIRIVLLYQYDALVPSLGRSTKYFTFKGKKFIQHPKNTSGN